MKKINTFAVVLLLLIGVFQIIPRSVAFLSPLPIHTDIFDAINAKLNQRSNRYHVYKERSIIPQVYAEVSLGDVNAYAVIDYDSGRILSESNIASAVPIASLTKIMTAVVALDLANPDEQITITEHAASMIPTKIGVIPGQKMTLRELLNASLLTSANDATQAIADGIDAKYGQPVFIKSMNAKAEFLKLKHSHFANPQGFDDQNNFSSVEDLAVLSHYAMQYPLVTEIVRKESQFLASDQNHKQFDLPNWNGVLGVYPNTIGMKIGNTGDARFTTVVLSERAGRRIMAIVLGAVNSLQRDLKASELLDMGYQMTMGLPAVKVTEAQLQAKYSTWNPFFK